MTKKSQAQLLCKIRDSVKQKVVSDPDMPHFVRQEIHKVIDFAWHDVMASFGSAIELESEVLALGLGHHYLETVGEQTACLSPRWIRARLLYAWAPFDMSLFGQMKLPLFWVMTFASLQNQYCIRVFFFALVLFLLVIDCPPDEFQLVSFILMLKGTTFLSDGVCVAIKAAVSYYECVKPDGTHTCKTTGPAAHFNLFTVLDLAGSCILVWTAFLLLPHSGRAAGAKALSTHHSSDAENPASPGIFRLCCGHFSKFHGGRLLDLFRYDLVCFAVSAALFVFLASLKSAQIQKGQGKGASRFGAELHPGRPLRKERELEYSDLGTAGQWRYAPEMYFAKLLYSLLSAPYVLFNIPGINTLLTHTLPTGYNKRGSCVPYMLRDLDPE